MLLDGRFGGHLTVRRATLRRYRRDTQITDRGRRYSRDIPSGPSRADCSSAVHSDHVSRLLGSQGGWRGRNTYLYDPMWYIWGVPPPFTAAQVITSSRSLRRRRNIADLVIKSQLPNEIPTKNTRQK